MRRYKTNSRQGLCNLFAEYVSEEISQNGKYETMISVSDCDTLILIKGYTKREDIVDVKDIVNKILRAHNHHEKEYIVCTDRKIDSDFIFKMSNGVEIARGYLGADARVELVATAQKKMIEMANTAGKPVLVANQVPHWFFSII
jgi:pyruvate kinase